MLLTTTRNISGAKGNIARETPCADLYTSPPVNEVTLDEFELFALDRLRLLRGIETLKVKNVDNATLKKEISAMVDKYDLNMNKDHSATRDLVSHFILRLAYCRTEDLRRWFLQQECMLFKHRLEVASKADFRAFMSKEGLTFDAVSAAEIESLGSALSAINDTKEQVTDYYRIPFKDALSLVSHRVVYLQKGFAYVPGKKLNSIIITKFRVQLSKALVEASNAFETVTPDQRIAPMLKNMNKQYIGRDFTKESNVDKLTVDKVDQAANDHMPLCMKNLHTNLRKESKLKHWGRLQYGLFLKGAGLELEDALRFWENHFSKVVTHDNFQKQYAYSFRHMYGKEGARKAYTPYSCMKIIMGTPPEPGAYHGCPYRHANDAQLGTMLMGLNIDSKDVNDIAKIARSGNYQIACQRHYDVTHPDHLSMAPGAGGGDSVANHPNQWYQSSVEYYKAKSGGSTNTATTAGDSSNQDVEGAMDISTTETQA